MSAATASSRSAAFQRRGGGVPRFGGDDLGDAVADGERFLHGGSLFGARGFIHVMRR